MEQAKKVIETAIQNSAAIDEIVSEVSRAIENEPLVQKTFYDAAYTLSEAVRMKRLELDKNGLYTPILDGAQLNAVACLACVLAKTIAKSYDAQHPGGQGQAVIYAAFANMLFKAYWTEEGPKPASPLIMQEIARQH